MMTWLMERLGVDNGHPKPRPPRVESAAELRYEQTKRATERVIAHADRERERLLSWEELFDDPRRRQ